MSDFASLTEQFADSLPVRWAHRRPGSILHDTVAVLDDLNDELVAALDQIQADGAIATASPEALRTEWAVLYGAGNEQLPADDGTLRDYVQQRAAEDGGEKSLINALLALLRHPENNGVPERDGLHFPADGAGLHFPADGSGLHFPPRARVQVLDSPETFTLTVQVVAGLVYDHAAFARAVQRHRPGHYNPPIIQEVP